MSLRNKTILITRRPEQSGEMVREITRRGGIPLLAPMIEISDPESWEPVDRIIGSLDRYDAILFASANAAERFLGRCGSRVESLRTRLHLALGERTQAVVERFGLRTRPMPDVYSGAGLVAALGSEEVRGKRILIPRGDRSRHELLDLLQSRGASVETVVVYRTVRADSLHDGDLREQIRSGSIDVVTFASPSAVENFGEALSSEERETLLGHAIVAVIGPTTAEAARTNGYDVAIVAPEATGYSLVHAIDNYFG